MFRKFFLPVHAGDDILLKNDPTCRIPTIKLRRVASEKRIDRFKGNVDAPVAGFTMKKPNAANNGRSFALVLSYERLKFFAGGDITWNVEFQLA